MNEDGSTDRFHWHRFTSASEAHAKVEQWIAADQRRRAIAQCAYMMQESHVSWISAVCEVAGVDKTGLQRHFRALSGSGSLGDGNVAFDLISLWAVREIDKPSWRIPFPEEWAATKQDIQQQIQEMREMGLSTDHIASVMNHDGYRGNRCAAFTDATVRGIQARGGIR